LDPKSFATKVQDVLNEIPINQTKPSEALDQWFLTWGKFTPGDKFQLPRG